MATGMEDSRHDDDHYKEEDYNDDKDSRYDESIAAKDGDNNNGGVGGVKISKIAEITETAAGVTMRTRARTTTVIDDSDGCVDDGATMMDSTEPSWYVAPFRRLGSTQA